MSACVLWSALCDVESLSKNQLLGSLVLFICRGYLHLTIEVLCPIGFTAVVSESVPGLSLKHNVFLMSRSFQF